MLEKQARRRRQSQADAAPRCAQALIFWVSCYHTPAINTRPETAKLLLMTFTYRMMSSCVACPHLRKFSLLATADDSWGEKIQAMGKELVELSSSDNGGLVYVYNKTGESIAQMYADDYGNGVLWAGNRKGKGKTLKPGR